MLIVKIEFYPLEGIQAAQQQLFYAKYCICVKCRESNRLK